jgi:superfamily I DNA/RNA helicase
VDEAQDILTDEYLDVLELVLDGALAGGRWVFFGDFDRQAIYLTGGRRAAEEMLASLRDRGAVATSYILHANCRNVAPIAETLTIACGVNPGYRTVLTGTEGGGVDLEFWETPAKQCDVLRRVLKELRRVYSPAEIVVLSLSADERSCAKHITEIGEGGLVPFRTIGDRDRTSVRYVSVHAFKGLEATAVIVTDIEALDERTKPLLYIAMSRAKVKLVLLMQESCRDEYRRMLAAGL